MLNVGVVIVLNLGLEVKLGLGLGLGTNLGRGATQIIAINQNIGIRIYELENIC
jgi:hypothetical protein